MKRILKELIEDYIYILAPCQKVCRVATISITDENIMFTSLTSRRNPMSNGVNDHGDGVYGGKREEKPASSTYGVPDNGDGVFGGTPTKREEKPSASPTYGAPNHGDGIIGGTPVVK
jgi:hypothetical protein